MQTAQPVGGLLRDWRLRRRLSQLDLALDVEISTRHLSFVETGRSKPSREMVLRLSERLEVPLREQNVLLTAAGYASVHPMRSLDDASLRAAREAIDQVLKGHEPFPALAVDRHWTMVAANGGVGPLIAGVSGDLLKPPVNVLRLSLRADGLAPRIANLEEWRGHLLARLGRQIEATADPVLSALMAELTAYPLPAGQRGSEPRGGASALVVPPRLVTDMGLLSFISTTTVFGTPVEVTLSVLAIESFFPADQATGDALRRSSRAT